jgi:hypothetical protein
LNNKGEKMSKIDLDELERQATTNFRAAIYCISQLDLAELIRRLREAERDVKRIDYLELIRQDGIKKGYNWDSYYIRMDTPIRDGIDLAMSQETNNG